MTLWLIPVAPLLGALIIAAIGRRGEAWAEWIAVAGMAAALGGSIIVGAHGPVMNGIAGDSCSR